MLMVDYLPYIRRIFTKYFKNFATLLAQGICLSRSNLCVYSTVERVTVNKKCHQTRIDTRKILSLQIEIDFPKN